jgi:hypothetical protein
MSYANRLGRKKQFISSIIHGYFPKNNYDQIRNENPKIGKHTTSVASKAGIKLTIKE